MRPVFPPNWFWIVGGDEERAWSSEAGAFLPISDASFSAWRDAGGLPSRIASETELGEVLASYGLNTGGLPAPRRELPKLMVQARLKALGRLQAAFDALWSDPDHFGRWFLDGANVYVDDEELLSLLSGIGCTEAEAAEVTALPD